MMVFLRDASFLLTLSLAACVAATAHAEVPAHPRVKREENRYRVRLGTADLVPQSGIHALAANRGEAFLVQFFEVPDVEFLARLDKAGFDLIQSVSGGSYLARCEPGCVDELASFSVRSAVDLTPAMKRAPAFERNFDLASRLDSKSPVEVVVRFFPWVSWDRGRSLVEQCKGVPTSHQPGYRNTITAMVDSTALTHLLSFGEIAWVDPVLPATGPSLVNAAERSRVDQVRRVAEYLGADGSDTRIGVLDWFADGIHTEFEERVTPVDVRWNEDDHGVRISGCIAGAGILEPRATGMAPGAELFWTSWVTDPWPPMERFHEEYDVTIVNNSWNTKPGWWPKTLSWHGELWAYGYYHERAAAADQLVRNTDLLVLFSAGNKREVSFLGPHYHGNQYGSHDDILHEDLHPPNPRYVSIAGAAVAKNVLTVGGTTKEDEIVYFSSLGPTNDGRVKPDIVAVGFDVLTTSAGDGYEYDGGTSISSPVVAGVAGLLTDFWRRRHGESPSSAVLKNLLIHSARDLGDVGPDYLSGFGMADAELAARIIDAAVIDDDQRRHSPRRSARRAGDRNRAERSNAKIKTTLSSANEIRSFVIEPVLDQGESQTFVLPVESGCQELRATLVWHDPPGPELVNDVDLRAVAPDGRVVHPFVLDPARPSAAASRGINRRDNVEQIRVHSPLPGLWRILVEGYAVAQGQQRVALVVSAGEGNRAPERSFEGDLVVDDFFVTGDDSSEQQPMPVTDFRDNDPLNFFVKGTVISNADYGDFWGSITLTVSVTDANGDTVVRFSAAGHTSGVGPFQMLLAVGHEIPSGLPAGGYTAHAVLVMHNGVLATADFPFTVENLM
jgi:hypothetical protein